METVMRAIQPQLATAALHPRQPLPQSVITAADYDRLVELVAATGSVMPELAFYLQQELDRATIAADVDPLTVQMGSQVRFHDRDSDRMHDIQLVYPTESSLAEGRLSVLTPVGSALLGQQAGTVTQYQDAVGRTKTLAILAVEPPSP
jgi:regulator of nucleoside diphosphate kinase